jgi:hypothetical protein
MSFMRSEARRPGTRRPGTRRPGASIRVSAAAVALSVALSVALAGAALDPAGAQVPDVTSAPAEISTATMTSVAPTMAALGAFCPRSTGRWWEDDAAAGCVARFADRDASAPISARELRWLDLGALAPYAVVDVDAIDAAIAAYELRLIDEQVQRALEEAIQREAARVTRAASTRRPVQRERPGQPYSNATIEQVLNECGYHDTTPRSLEEQDRHRVSADRCIESRMPGYWDWVMATERERFGERPLTPAEEAAQAAEDARRLAEFEVWLAELSRKDAAARARLEERKERARQEIRDRCPHGGFASPTVTFASSYDEVDYVVTCYPGPG